MHQPHRFASYISVVAMLMTSACLTQKAERNRAWNSIDYRGIVQNAYRDNDSYYSLPVNTGCLDDAPNNPGDCQ